MRKIYILIVLAFLVLAYVNQAFAQVLQFNDLPLAYWAHNTINTMVTRGYILGYPDGSFKPEKEMTREEFAVLLVRCMGITPTRANISSFIDIPDEHWSIDYVEAVKEYLPGYSAENGRFSFLGTKSITREDVTAALVKAQNGVNAKQADINLLEDNFKDYSSIVNDLRPFIAIALKNKLISGFPDGTFRPKDPLTRSQAATLLYRAFCQTDSVIKNMIGMGDISTLDTSDQLYDQLSSQLNNNFSHDIIDGKTYSFSVYVKNAAQNSEQLNDLIYIFANSNDPFSFEAANKTYSEQVQKYMERIRNLVGKYYPAQPLLIMTGYSKKGDKYWWMQANSLFKDTDYIISINDKAGIYQVEKFFSGVLYVGGSAIERF